VEAYVKIDEAAVTAALKRTPTREERIAASLALYYESKDGLAPYWSGVPPSRLLQVGQAVTVGNLREARVASVHEDGQILTIEHRTFKNQSDKEMDWGTSFGTWYWLDVLPIVATPATTLSKTPAFTSQSYFNTQLEHLIKRVYRDGVSDAPAYQREYVWTLADKELLLEALFNGRPIGRFIFVKEKYPNADILFDGKQRMNTLLELVSSKLPYKGVFWHEMAPSDRQAVLGRSVQFAELDVEQYSKADLLDIFLEVNAAGVPQTQAHLEKVRAMRDAERAKEAAQAS
jgi:hypothetical protein